MVACVRLDCCAVGRVREYCCILGFNCKLVIILRTNIDIILKKTLF